jgi:hypothetical protein
VLAQAAAGKQQILTYFLFKQHMRYQQTGTALFGCHGYRWQAALQT